MHNHVPSNSAFSRPRVLTAVALFAIGIGFSVLALAGAQTNTVHPAKGALERTTLTPKQALQELQNAGRTEIFAQTSEKTGAFNFVKAVTGGTIAAANASDPPKARALAFLSANGALVGMTVREMDALRVGGAPVTGSDLQIAKVEIDSIGSIHVRLNQFYQGLRVFGAQLVVHMNDAGITVINGDYVPDVSLSTIPNLNEGTAMQTALAAARKNAREGLLKPANAELAIYPLGLLEGMVVQPRLAYAVEVSGGQTREQVWVDANSGAILNRISLTPQALYRIAYSPQYDPANPDQFALRKEAQPPLSPVPGQNSPIDNLYDFTGQTYNFYASAFNRDSYDGAGKIMRTVLLVNNQCPNAYWNGSTTNYCPAFDEDDVVSHEWSHAYTEYTHGLIYSYQSGALNESYSDIFGETVDLLNGVDGSGGNDNANHAQYGDNGSGVIIKTGGGVRFQIGEDFQGLNQPAVGILRDMYTPSAFNNPDKVSSARYSCGSDDSGGVHNNSGVPNHAYALAVDGGTFNGQTLTGIGLTKAAAIWFRAETVYQGPTTNFAAHQNAIETSCSDLTGQTIYVPRTDSAVRVAAAETISAQDCAQVHKAMLAVEMSSPIPCNFPALLDPTTPAICDHAQTIYSETWESGTLDGWTLLSIGERNNAVGVKETNPDWPGTNWVIRGNLPGGHTNKAVFAIDATDGTCAAGGDHSGHFAIVSPPITVPAGGTGLKVSFDHYVQTETGFDGGNLLVKVNTNDFVVVPQDRYIFNAPNQTLNPAIGAGDGNTDPKAGEYAWTGANLSNGTGSWGTTIVDLSSMANPGDSIQLKYDFGQDGCGGANGWFVDNIKVYNCPVFLGPTLSAGADYENPDTNGSYTLNWVRPAGANPTGPDVLQVSQTSCAPVLFDDAESGLGKWNATHDGILSATWTTSNAKPQHAPNTAFWAMPASEQGDGSAMLTYKTPITIPATGVTTLNFTEWYFNENDDRGYVEISTDNGATWTAIYTNARDMGALPDEGAFAFVDEDFNPQHLDLTQYGGKTIRLRFRYFQGASDFTFFVQYGWYIDDISLTNDSWLDVAQVSGTSFTDHKPSGNYCYRVNTTFLIGSEAVPSLPSNVVNVTVAPGIPRIVSRKSHGTAGIYELDLPIAGPIGVESRRGGDVNFDTHQVVFEFSQVATFTGASVSSQSNPPPAQTPAIDSTSGSGTNQIIVNLKNVSDVQTLTLNLSGVNAGAGLTSISVPMGVLLGDVNGSRRVDGGDVLAARNQNLEDVSVSNFKDDVNTSGRIDGGDVLIIRNRNLFDLPSSSGSSRDGVNREK